MRSNYQLYKLLRAKHIRFSENPEAYYSIGICHLIDHMYGTREIEPKEYTELRLHFIGNRPTCSRHPEFFTEPNFRRNEAYWWDNRQKEESDNSRLRFLDKMILITKPTHVKIFEKIINLIKRIK